jgi:glyoxylase-like metal-dependent hydrolase (beta-lactamase superfamily II)
MRSVPAMTESELASLGVVRIPIPIPFLAAGGPVNVYLLEEADGGLLMWDSGLGSPEAEAALEDGFRRAGRRFEEVTRILLSHGHVDHYGAARFVQERHGGTVPVRCHPADAAKVAESGWRWRDRRPMYAAFLARLGTPAGEIEAMGREGERGFRLARRVPAVLPLEEGDEVRTRHLSLRALHMPGHTPGLVCLHDPERRLLLSGDHLLERISPNPLIELGPGGEEGFFRPLVAYLASLERTRALELDLVLPGHGPPFAGHRRVVDDLLAFYARRMGRIRELLDGGPLSAWEVSRALFPSARPGDAFLTISETIANLEVMEARGEVRRSAVDGVYRFR